MEKETNNNQEIREQQIEKKIKLWKKFMPILFYVIAIYIGPIALVLGLSLFGKVNMSIYYVGSLILQLGAIAAIYYFCKKNDIVMFEKTKFKWWYIVVVVGVWIINMLKIIPLTAIFGTMSTANGDALGAMAQSNLWYTVLYGVALGPILEEFIFRGVLMKTIFAKYQWLGLLISSLLFCFIHTPTDWFSFFNYFTMGLLFGGTFMITKSLKWTMITHIFNNALAIIPMVIMISMGLM